MISINPEEVGNPKIHHYLLGAIGPRPICLASTIDNNGVPNLAPFSFFNVFSSNPPVAIFSPARSGRTGKQKDTYNNVKENSEVVINVVTHSIVEKVSLSSSPYSPEIDEFVKSGFTPIKSELIKPFRVKESPVQLECKVFNVIELGETGGAGNLILCNILRIHIDENILDENSMIDQRKIDLVSRMGGNWYCRADENSMFEITKPITTCGVGYDLIPKDILSSNVLDSNELAKLAGIEEIPDETQVNEYKLIELCDIFLKYDKQDDKLKTELHILAKNYLKEDKIKQAWMTLLAFN